jgi:Zn-dependent protease
MLSTVFILFGIFNLISLPPLDGGHFLPYLLPRGSWTLLRQLEQYGPLILFLLVLSGATGHVINPVFAGMDALYRELLRLII